MPLWWSKKKDPNELVGRILTARTLISKDYSLGVGSRNSNTIDLQPITDANREKLRPPKDVELVKILGSGVSGEVWLARDPQQWFAIKYIKFRRVADLVLFRQEAYYQRLFAEIHCAPRLEETWKVPKPPAGVLKMQAVDGIASDVIKRHKFNPVVLKYIAAETFRLCVTIASRNLVHGDPHFQNIAIEMSTDRRTPALLFIDFGRSFQIQEPFPHDVSKPLLLEYLLDADKFWIWRATMFEPVMNRYMRESGFPGSMLMKKILGESRPRVDKPFSAQLVLVENAPEVHRLQNYQKDFKAAQTAAQNYADRQMPTTLGVDPT